MTKEKLLHIGDILTLATGYGLMLKQRPPLPDGSIPEFRNRDDALYEIITFTSNTSQLNPFEEIALWGQLKPHILEQHPDLEKYKAPTHIFDKNEQNFSELISAYKNKPENTILSSFVSALTEHTKGTDFNKRYGSPEEFTGKLLSLVINSSSPTVGNIESGNLLDSAFNSVQFQGDYFYSLKSKLHNLQNDFKEFRSEQLDIKIVSWLKDNGIYETYLPVKQVTIKDIDVERGNLADDIHAGHFDGMTVYVDNGNKKPTEIFFRSDPTEIASMNIDAEHNYVAQAILALCNKNATEVLMGNKDGIVIFPRDFHSEGDFLNISLETSDRRAADAKCREFKISMPESVTNNMQISAAYEPNINYTIAINVKDMIGYGDDKALGEHVNKELGIKPEGKMAGGSQIVEEVAGLIKNLFRKL